MLRFFRLLMLLLVFTPLLLTAQISKPGIPPGFSKSSGELDIPFETFYMRHVAALQAEDEVTDTIHDIPWRFGENLNAGLGLENAGTWQTLETGERIWRLGIRSPDAYSLNLTFNRYRLPPGAELYIYSEDRSFVLGAFTSFNNQDDYYFASSLVPGDALIIEYLEPAFPDFPGELHLETVTHAYRNVFDFIEKFGRSGACNINVACEEARGWEDQIDAVVAVFVGSNSLCTGALINNTNFDGRPYLLTANHCYRNPSTLVFWFNYQSSTCENPASRPEYDVMSGAASRANFSGSDFWLLELNQRVPLEYNPYFAGWNRTLDSALLETVTTIHHPRGDIKKFSYAHGGAATSSYVGAPGSGTSHWRVVWSGGTTEPSSSGAPLFDAKGLIIGQLHGGYAACGNNEPDWYGRFGISWDAASGHDQRLSNWLDPYGTNVMSINGLRAAASVVDPPSALSAETISPDSIILTWSFNADQQPILLAYNLTDTFGDPAGGYALGDTIIGGGILFFFGNEDKPHHRQVAFNPLQANTKYFFRAWSYNDLKNYSEGLDAFATSETTIISAFPYEEHFRENRLPYGWNQPPDNNRSWKIGRGNGTGNPKAPFQGNYNLFFNPYPEEGELFSDILASPVMDLSAFGSARLSLHYTTFPNLNARDQLILYYRKAPENAWQTLIVLSEAISEWTSFELELPEVSSASQLGFQAYWKGGLGVCLDAIRIVPVDHELFPPPKNLATTLVTAHAVHLAWEPPDQTMPERTPLAYQVFRNDLPLVLIDAQLPLVHADSGLALGSYRYRVVALYDDPAGESQPGNTVFADIRLAAPPVIVYLSAQGEGVTIPPSPSEPRYNPNTPVTFVATPAPSHEFAGWYKNNQFLSPEPVITIMAEQWFSLRAVFTIKQYRVETLAVPEGTGVQQGAGTYDYAQKTTVSTTVPLGYRFMHWESNGQVLSNNYAFKFTVYDNASLTASFQPLFTVNLTASPPEGGSVKGDGIYPQNSQVILQATPNHGWNFAYWQENEEMLSHQKEYQFLISTNREITALFSRFKPEVSIELLPANSGIASGSGSYTFGDTVTITFEPFPNWNFVGWMENNEQFSTETSYTFVIEENRHFVAVTEPRFYVLTIDIEGKGKTEPAPGQYSVEKNQQVLLKAQPDRGWRFKHWEINGIIHDAPETEVLMQKEVNALAVFIFPTSANPGQSLQNQLRVFPNPTGGLFHLETGPLSGKVWLELYNTSGQLIMQSDHDLDQGDSLISFDLTGMNQGVYLLRLLNHDITLYQKIIKR